jgi:hypothetical protein
MGISVKLTGDWNEATVLMRKHKTGLFLRKAFDVAVRKQAQEFRKEVVEGIKSGAPGGKKFTPNTPLTVAFKGSTKPLIDSGTLWRSIKVQRVRRSEYFVGILWQTQSSKKKGPSYPLVNLAYLHEEGGSVAIKVTPKMQSYFFAMLRKLGKARRGKKARRAALHIAKAVGGGHSFKVGRTIVIHIPARPFMKPVYEQFSKGARDRVIREVARELGGDFGIA